MTKEELENTEVEETVTNQDKKEFSQAEVNKLLAKDLSKNNLINSKYNGLA